MVIKNNTTFSKRFNQDIANYDWVLIAVTVALCVGGLAFLASSLSPKGFIMEQSEFVKQLIIGPVIGGLIAYRLAKLDYHWLFKRSGIFVAITLGFLAYLAMFAILAAILGKSTLAEKIALTSSLDFLPVRPFIANGAIRWINLLYLINFQPSELAKLTILIYFSAILNKYEKEKITILKLKKPLYLFLLSAFLILVQPDLGNVLLIFGIILSAMWVSKVSVKILLPISIIVVFFGAFFAFNTEYRRNRINAVSDQTGQYAYQINNIKTAIKDGQLWGKGYGNSRYKQIPYYIPEIATDGILAVIGEEMGFIFTTAFLSLYLIFLWRGLKIAKQAPDIGGRALATGLSIWLVSQAFLNITGVTGITPLKGLPLPFVSSGGSAMLLNLLAVGILLNISSQSETKNKFAQKYSLVR